MKQILAPFVLSVALVMPLYAQDPPLPDPAPAEEGFGLVERGMRLLFEGLIRDMEPALGEMAEAMQKLEPMARQLADLIGDVQFYDAPERLDNGDIIIRRKAGAPPPPKLPVPDANPPVDASPEGQIEL
jgi:hypothetical protein